MLKPVINYRFIILNALMCLVLIGTPHLAFSQDRKQQLEADKKKIEEEIDYTNKLLNETRRNKEASLNQLVILNKKISSREALIDNINTEIDITEKRISDNNKEIKQLEAELQNLKEEYARMIYYAYKNRNAYDRLMFIFSSKDFNQAYQRLKYFQQYGSYRKVQAELIQKAERDVELKIQELEEHKSEKVDLMKDMENEVKVLRYEKEEKNSTLDVLSRKESDLRSTIRKKEKEEKKLEEAIETIIAEEIRAAAERARKEAENEDAMMTEAEIELSDNFSLNKGKFPWPSEKGIISSTFGEHQHPILKKVKIKNNGIDILTDRGGIARVIFEGTVISTRAISNTNKAIIVKHGEYFTVYSNLIDVYVKRGDIIKTQQNLGLIYTDPEDNKTELHFEIWKGKTLLNPSYWLTGK